MREVWEMMSDDSTATVEATKGSKLSTGASSQEIQQEMVAKLAEVRLHPQDFYMMGETEAKLVLGELYPNVPLVAELIETYSDSSSSNLPEVLDTGAGSLQEPTENSQISTEYFDHLTECLRRRRGLSAMLAAKSW